MDAYLRERDRLLAAAAPGLDSARLLSSATDVAVKTLAEQADTLLPGPWAVCALGGWGAGALLPESDLDLLILSNAPERALRSFVEVTLYPLWDAGLKVGHQVRSPKAHLSACRKGEIETLTASLTARVIAGDSEFGQRVLRDVVRDAHRRSRAVLDDLARRQRVGSPFLLEPQLKEGAGGRRDYDELVWSAAVTSGRCESDPYALVAAGLLSPAEFDLIEHSAGVMAAARWSLQLAGAGDRLSLEHAYTLTVDPSHVQKALVDTWLVLNRVRRRIKGDRAAHAPERMASSGLFALLDKGESSLEALEEAAATGDLDELVPGMGSLMSLRRPGLAHTLTVGAHCLRSAVTIAELKASPGALAHSAELVPDVRALQAAALVHDAGKREPGPGHAERGALNAAHAASRLGLSADSATTAAELVRLHLALVETAHHEDLDDEDVLLRAAARIGRRDLVAPLHLLTVADSLATGPAAWSTWFDALLAKLVARLDVALSTEEDGAGLVARAATVRSEARATVPSHAGAERAFIDSAPVRYLASRSAAEALRDARLVSGLSATSEAECARIAVGAGPTTDSSTVTVAAWDRPFLLSRLAGAIALAGLDILAFDAHGVTGRIALDTFVVESATARALTPDVFSRLERLLNAALRDRYELATRLAERRRHYPARGACEPRVEVRPGGWDTTVRVTAPDRPGLLHDLAWAVSATDLDIRWARARTIDGVANDTFHIVGADGGPVDDPGVLGHLTMRLRETL